MTTEFCIENPLTLLQSLGHHPSLRDDNANIIVGYKTVTLESSKRVDKKPKQCMPYK